MKCGIVGLPNVGKSSLFNILINKQQASVANYAFCTIDPNIATVDVMDERLNMLSKISNSKNIVYTTLKIVDIAGLVPGASDGEGLGNKFLNNIVETDLILHVVRCFQDAEVQHTEGNVNPIRDLEIINNELIQWDIQKLESYMNQNRKSLKEENKKILEQILNNLKEGKIITNYIKDKKPEEKNLIIELMKEIPLITKKPMLILCNIDNIEEDEENVQKVQKYCEENNMLCTVASSKNKSGIDNLVKECYRGLDLISFLTTGQEETRGWTLKKGTIAHEAASKIHGDFKKYFVCIDVVPYEKFVENNGWAKCKSMGQVRNEGKTYEIQDGDVILFKKSR